MGVVSVVREQQQAGRVPVEPPHRKEPQAVEFLRQQLQDSWQARVLRRTDISLGLVQQKVAVFRAIEPLPVHADIALTGKLAFRRCYGRAVHADPAGADQGARLAAGIEAAVG